MLLGTVQQFRDTILASRPIPPCEKEWYLEICPLKHQYYVWIRALSKNVYPKKRNNCVENLMETLSSEENIMELSDNLANIVKTF